MTASTDTTTDPKALFNEVREYIAHAKGLVEQNKYIELEGLGGMVEKLCTHIQQLPVGEATKYGEELDQLVVELNDLQREFAQRRDQLKDEITSANTHKKAARAYKQSESMHVPSSVTDLPPEGDDNGQQE
tara:strand:- start:366 stop:758 length:393 start_codon:yes stop_codon:yes gene_type:complete